MSPRKLTAHLRTLLILGRVSNLPTVWSNCLAGWWLGGDESFSQLLRLSLGASLLYTGGMFMNDVCDAWFDVQHRRERPIPSGAIQLKTVWLYTGLLGGAGVFCLTSKANVVLISLLALCIVAYNLFHKGIIFAPALMGACRFFLYLVAASTGAEGVTGWAIWCGLVLAAYIVGLSYLARVESVPGALRYWPLILLASPIVLALILNAGSYRQQALLLSVILALWLARCLWFAFWAAARNIGRAVSGLLAGIVLVDLLAVVDMPFELQWIFPVLFVAAMLLQRFVPAT